MYPAKYHGDNPTLANYLVEIVMERQAKKADLLLYEGFWRSILWKKEYAKQAMAAHALIKLIDDEKLLIQTIHDLNWIYSLAPKFVREKIIAAKAKKDAKAQREKERFASQEIEVKTVESSGKRRRVFK